MQHLSAFQSSVLRVERGPVQYMRGAGAAQYFHAEIIARGAVAQIPQRQRFTGAVAMRA
jgi:hypothetical protein